jgi:hypothetical protein
MKNLLVLSVLCFLTAPLFSQEPVSNKKIISSVSANPPATIAANDSASTVSLKKTPPAPAQKTAAAPVEDKTHTSTSTKKK